MSTGPILEQLLGQAPPTPNEPPPVPYRVQLAHNIVTMYSAKSSHGLHAASVTHVPSTDLSEKEQKLYHQCIEVISTWISGENDHDPAPVDDLE